MYMESTNNLLSFLDNSPSQYHAVNNVRKMLCEAGFVELNEGTLPKISHGAKYFITKNESALIAFVLPEKAPKGYLISASHSDSPTFKIKNNAEISVDNKYVKLNIEKYGGMLCSTWLDRPLSIAGKVLVANGDNIETKLVYIDRDLLIIPNLCIHMNRTANSGYEFKANVDMLPLFGGEDAKDSFMRIVAENIGVAPEAILGTDLYLCNRTKGSIWGANSEFVSAPRLDDLQCAYSTLVGFLEAEMPNEHVQMYMLADNEEIGSDTKQGAGSPFLFDTLSAINLAYGGSSSDYSKALTNSFMLSCDNAHAVHPNHTAYSDASDRPYLNGGVVIKYGVRYATCSVSEAIFRSMCHKASVPYQTYSNRPDLLGGATLGNISNTKVSLNTVDIGLAQLAMHSSYETAGASDAKHLTDICRYFYSVDIEYKGVGNYTLN